ncbi:MAG TPA: hypothetical protein PLE67_11050 [Tenuifilaceae bacterium]|nr:hypothetical protein [Tenuifilaceae bacterium]
MKKIRFTLILLLASFSILSSSAQVRIDLSNGWKFRKVNTNDEWLAAKVPGSLHSDLFRNNIIPDPFLGCNHSELDWIEESEWEYSLNFPFEENFGKFCKVYLVFEGIDTHAEIILNGEIIGKTNNMFRTWKIDVTNKLLSENNILSIQFFPAKSYVEEQKQKYDFELPGGEWAHVRKAAFQFGWDFAPRLLTCGIWKPVYLQTNLETSLCGGNITVQSVDSLEAKLTASFNTVSNTSRMVTLKIYNALGWQEIASQKVDIPSGSQTIDVPFSIQNPILWWPNGAGSQYLYDMALVLEAEDISQQVVSQKVGIRSIDVVNETDSWGTSFFFRVNGKPIFIKGANIVPPNSINPNIAEPWVQLAKDAKYSNMNMLRVWGGGVYPPNKFFESCDSLGILVWQDFMFACSMYPWDEEFLNNVQNEATEQVKRLKKFTSLAMWCGNNEVDEGWHNWGWQAEVEDSLRIVEVWDGYRKLFHEILPEIVRQNDSTRFYWSSSPQYGWGTDESLDHGDSHYWGVWWGKEPFSKYRFRIPRFMSEFGFQGYPNIKTIERFAQHNSPISEESIECHQKHTEGKDIIDMYLRRDGFVSQTIEEKSYFSQLTQAIGYQTAIENHRLAAPRCMGTLYWQLNDCWPAISWSGIDFYGGWKAVQYQAKRSFQPLLVSPEFRGSKIVVRLVSDNAYPVEGDLIVTIYSEYGKKLGVWREYITLEPNEPFKAIDEKLYDDPSYNLPMFAVAEFMVDINESYYGFASNTNWGELNLREPEIEYEVIKSGNLAFIELKSKRHAFFVEISNDNGVLKFEDNFFHMVPGERYSIELLKGDAEGITVKSLWDYLQEK